MPLGHLLRALLRAVTRQLQLEEGMKTDKSLQQEQFNPSPESFFFELGINWNSKPPTK